MRFGAGIGLLGLLVVVAIAFVWFQQTQIPIAKKGKETQDQAKQLSGHGPDGLPAAQSITLEPKGAGGRTDHLLVTSIVAGGALEKYFGLQKGDQIIQVGQFAVREYPGGDDLAIAGVHEAAQRRQELVIRRNGQTQTLAPNGGAGIGALQNNIKIPTH
jgi:hypothetical protein